MVSGWSGPRLLSVRVGQRAFEYSSMKNWFCMPALCSVLIVLLFALLCSLLSVGCTPYTVAVRGPVAYGGPVLDGGHGRVAYR